MIKRFNITKEDFRAIRDGTGWKPFIRKFEVDKILDGFARDHFDKALELGCGSGKYSKYLASYCKKLIALEYNESRLTEHSDEKTTFLIGDAQDLSQFGNSEMDLIFSSNLIEHLPNPDQCLAECSRVVKQDGLIIHTVPNRTWKIFHLLLYYPFGIKIVLWRMFAPGKAGRLSEFLAADTKLDSSLRPLNGLDSLKKNLLPKVHGISKSHLAEFKNWAEKRWLTIFERNGLEVVNIVRLPFYHGWDSNFRFILRLGNYLRLSSSTAFILKKAVKGPRLAGTQAMNYRLLMLNYEFPPIGGGAGSAHLSLLTQYANNSELKVDVFTSAPKPGFFEQRFSENITIYKVGIHKKDLHFWRRAEVIEWLLKAKFHYRRLLRENDYDLVHAFFGFPTGWLCYRSANKLPYIISLRGSDVPGYNIRLGLDYKLMAGLFRKIWSRATAVVANSKGLQKLALDFMPDLDIKVIPNGVDTERFYPSEKQIPAKPIQALTVCRLIRRKRIGMLIEAVARAKESALEIQLNIAGEGRLMQQLKKLASDLNVADRINFMGRVPPEEMPQLYRSNHIFIMSSAHEGMSNAMLEAMASGLPVITTRCEGVEELIADNGLVVEQANAEEIAKAVRKLADDRQAHKRMSIAARRQAEKFGWDKTALSYVEQYRKILN